MAIANSTRSVTVNDGTVKEVLAAEVTTLGIYHLRISANSIPAGNIIEVKVTDKIGADTVASTLLKQDLRPGETGLYVQFVLKNAGHITVQRTTGSSTFTLECDVTIAT